MNISVTDDLRWLKIEECTQQEYSVLRCAYNKPVQGYKFMPLYKKGLWDGHMNFLKGQYIPYGSIGYLKNICAQSGFKLNLSGIDKIIYNVSFEDFSQWCHDFFKTSELKPRDYQIESAWKIVHNRFSLSELATSAGKTLITFIALAYLLKHNLVSKVLMVVPTTELVLQSSEDFKKYNEKCNGKLDLNVSMIYEGKHLEEKANITVGTFQSLVKWENSELQQIDCVVVDETHKAKCKSIQTILSKCDNAKFKFGLTGTMPDIKYSDYLTIASHIGPLITSIKAAELQERGYISKCHILQIYMNYLEEENKSELSRAMKHVRSVKGPQAAFNLEKEVIISNPKRFGFIISMMELAHKNTLVLFHRRKYGKILYQQLKDRCPGKIIMFIDGNVATESRDSILKTMQENQNVILVASYATVGTGISVERIENIVFAESFKSPHIILQAVGRGLRLKEKLGLPNKVTIIDLVDDFRTKSPSFTNYMYLHGNERKKLYKEASYPFEIKKIKI